MEALQQNKKNITLDPIQQSVLNKKVSLPPNKIITKEYSPDVKPLVKLMTKEQLQKSQKNISYLPPRVKNPEFQNYGQKFYPMDFLGYKYAEEFDQMVYFRYNNEEFNELKKPSSEKGTKYFAGLFIPYQALQSKQFKAEDNIYAALNLSIPQMKDSITQSFAKNCKGCSFDPLFSSNFTSGNMMAAIRKKPFEYDIILQNDTNCKGAEWFNFAVKFIEEGTYTFNIVNLSNENPLYEMGMKIPYFSFLQQSLKSESVDSIRSGNGWSFGGKNVSLHKTDVRKQDQLMDQTYYCLQFQFKCKNRQQIVVFASSVPYTSLDYERFLNRVLFNKIGQHMKMQKIQLCQTLGGSPLSAFVFYHRKSKSNTLILKNSTEDRTLDNFRSSERHKSLNLSSQSASSFLNQGPILENPTSNQTKSIVFMARQHSGDTASSFLLEGVIDFLMDNTEFDIFKKNFQFVIIPFVNADGVRYGNQRVNLAGADLNKCWKNPNETFEPEAFHIKKFLKKVHQLHPISMMINLSSNRHSLSSHFTSASQKKYCDQLPELFPYICSKRIQQISFQRESFYPNEKQSLVRSLGGDFSKSLVYEFSTSLYGWKTEYSGVRKNTQSSFTSDDEQLISEFTPDIYRSMGRDIIATYLEYVRLCEKNFGIRDRWLKEIQDLPLVSPNDRKQAYLHEKKYEETWDRERVHVDYSLYAAAEQSKNQTTEGRKHKSTLQYRFTGTPAHEPRSRHKKLTMPNIKNSKFQSQDKENINLISEQSRMNSDNSEQKDSSMDAILNQLKKTPLTSSVFSPKRKYQILKEISQSIRQSSQEKESSFTGLPQNNTMSPHLQKLMSKQGRRVSKLIEEQKNETLVPKTLVLKQEDSKTKVKDAIVKFQNMKKANPLMGNRADGKLESIQRA